eukprot:700659-Amphidinium_carterae.1
MRKALGSNNDRVIASSSLDPLSESSAAVFALFLAVPTSIGTSATSVPPGVAEGPPTPGAS